MVKVRAFFDAMSNKPGITFADRIKTTIKDISITIKKNESKQ